MEVPALLMGCSPFIGAGQFGLKALQYYQKFHLQPENMVRLFQKSFDLGVEAIQLLAEKPIEALVEASRITGVKPYVIYSTHLFGSSLKRILEKLSILEPEVVTVHAEVADRQDVDRISERLDLVEEYGAILGLATHRPGTTLPWVEKERVPVEIVLAPLNITGYAMEPRFEDSMEAIEKCTRRIVAIKPLAAGRLDPREAFSFVYKYAESAAVGVTSVEEMEETYKAALEEYTKLKTVTKDEVK